MNSFTKFIKLFLLALIISNSSAANNELKLEHFKLDEKNFRQFKLEIPERCMFGDFNAIQQEMMYSPGSRLRFSVKVLNQDLEKISPFLDEISAPPQNSNLNEFHKKIMQGEYKFRVEFPSVQNTSLAIMAICKDTKKTRSCSSAKIVDLNTILKQYENPTSGFKPEDHIYFYQPVLIKKGEVLFFSDTISTKNLDLAVKLIKQESISLNDEQIKKFLEDISLIASLPIKIADTDYKISLPVYSPKKCKK